MARPPRFIQPTKLTLSMESEVREAAHEVARLRKTSVSALFCVWLQQEIDSLHGTKTTSDRRD